MIHQTGDYRETREKYGIPAMVYKYVRDNCGTYSLPSGKTDFWKLVELMLNKKRTTLID